LYSESSSSKANANKEFDDIPASLDGEKKKLPKTKEKKSLSRRLNFFNFLSDFEDEQRQQKRGTVADRRA
jgi:hypothetical protein